MSPPKRLAPMGGACEAVATAEKGRNPIGSRNRRGAGGGGSACGARRRRAAAGEDNGGRARWRARRNAIREGSRRSLPRSVRVLAGRVCAGGPPRRRQGASVLLL